MIFFFPGQGGPVTTLTLTWSRQCSMERVHIETNQSTQTSFEADRLFTI